MKTAIEYDTSITKKMKIAISDQIQKIKNLVKTPDPGITKKVKIRHSVEIPKNHKFGENSYRI